MKLRLLLCCLVGILWGCQDQSSVEDPAGTHFIKFYGRDGDQTGRDLVVLPDGSVVLFGTSRSTKSTVGSQFYVVRVDSKGAIVWEKEFGGPQDEEARDIELTSTGNIVVAGNSYRAVDDRDVMILTLDVNTGTLIDSALHFVHTPPPASLNPLGDEDVATITETADGFVVAGSTTYVPVRTVPVGVTDTHDALKLRVYADLTIYPPTWRQSYGYPAEDYSVKIVVAPASTYGDYYAYGSTDNRPLGSSQTTFDYNFWMVVLGANGDPIGIDTYSGLVSKDERASSHCLSPAGSFMAGVVDSGSSPQDLYIMEAGLPDSVNGFGRVKENYLSFNLGSGLSGATAVASSPVAGGYLILGNENGFNANQNWMLTRMNSDGTLAWSQPIVYGGEGLDEIGAVKELPDGRIILVGTMRTGRPDAGEFKMTLIKVDKDGKFEK